VSFHTTKKCVKKNSHWELIRGWGTWLEGELEEVLHPSVRDDFIKDFKELLIEYVKKSIPKRQLEAEQQTPKLISMNTLHNVVKATQTDPLPVLVTVETQTEVKEPEPREASSSQSLSATKDVSQTILDTVKLEWPQTSVLTTESSQLYEDSNEIKYIPESIDDEDESYLHIPDEELYSEEVLDPSFSESSDASSFDFEGFPNCTQITVSSIVKRNENLLEKNLVRIICSPVYFILSCYSFSNNSNNISINNNC
ncbi:unnamed protein product, partial [Meganyctiphanes norvegica]